MLRSLGDWPELHAQLAAGLTQGSAEEAECCVELIGVLLDDCGPDVARLLGPLVDAMLRHASSEASPPGLRRQCLSTFVAGVHALLRASDCSPAAVESAAAGLPAWFAVAASLCAGPESWGDADRVACAFTAVRAATTLSRLRPLEAALVGSVEAVLRPACLLLQQLDPAYGRTVVDADDAGASEEEAGLASLIAQVMELLQAMLEKPKLRALLKGHARSLLQLLVPFMRITEAQVMAWRADPNEFLAHEEDERCQGCQIRMSAEGLVGAMMEHQKREAGKAIAGLAGELLDKGEQARAAGSPHAWKITEVALLIFADTASEIPTKALQRGASGGFGIKSGGGELAAMVPTVLGLAGRLCADSSAPDFLRARAFALLRKLGDAVCALAPQDLPALLRASAAGLAQGEPLPVRVSACRVFCRFLSASQDVALKEALLRECGVLASLASLVRDASEELLHLALESLCLVIKCCPGAMASVEEELGQLVAQLWRRTRDELTHLQILDVISCAAGSHARLQRAMETHLLPAVREGLKPEADPHETASAVELLGTLLQRASVPLEAHVWSCVELLPPAVLRCDESMLMQNACDALIVLVKRTPGQIVDGGLLEPLLRCVGRFLGPDLDDDACLFAGPFVTLLLVQLGGQLSAELRADLLRALVSRLARAERPYLQQGLIVVVARLLHQDIAGVLTVLRSTEVVVGADGSGVRRNGLEAFLTVWLARAKEILAKRARSVTVSALCKLHEHCLKDPQLASLRLAGDANEALAASLFGAVVDALEHENSRTKKLRDSTKALAAGNFDDDEDEDDDDEDEDKGDFGRGDKKLEKYLHGLVDLDDDDDGELSLGGDFDDDALAVGGGESATDVVQQLEREDPLSSLDVGKTAAEYLAANAAFAAGSPALAARASAAVVEAHALASSVM
eukprot:TRINITY_DN26739_c0_g1_i1.p1 TRINITY_DN26739_c0_g1~~TRINITY_DN26739_c0_g1_i1.p1  ORF type:complete len:1049 (-),score=269.06 TRINITY_DN26739_c0_g1_i1:431-3184(-)